MKKFIPLFLLLLAFAACTSDFEKKLNEIARGEEGDLFFATLEDAGMADLQTKVYADEQLRVLWDADDRISIFNKKTSNQEYKFMGEDGDNAGNFEAVGTIGEGNGLSYIYAVYPYAPETSIDGDGLISLSLPAEQTYQANSFGKGANTMISVTEDNMLRFKNVGGYLSFKLYGKNVSVRQVQMTGNHGETLSGEASVRMDEGGVSALSLAGKTVPDTLTLVCEKPIALSAAEDEYTEFWFVVPPMTFTDGFSVIVTDAFGGTFTHSTHNPVTIGRNTLSHMAPLEVVFDYDHSYVPFKDENFKAYCVENYDSNHDGEISYAEALNIFYIYVGTDNIANVQGIEFMSNLSSLYLKGSGTWDETTQEMEYHGILSSLNVSNNLALTTLVCAYNKLSALDISSNIALTELNCRDNQITALNISKNTSLLRLNCSNNKLTALELSKNLSLNYLFCNGNQISELDVSNNISLSTFNCSSNQISELDVSKNTSLSHLSCANNKLTNLDVSKNTDLTSLLFHNNTLSSIDISHNTALSILKCNGNSLASLDVSNNKALTELYCRDNQLTALNINNNTALTDLYCSNNQLTTLVVSNNTALYDLRCDSNHLITLDISKNTDLTHLICDDNKLTALDVSNNTALMELQCRSNPNLLEIWLKTGQVITYFQYDTAVATIKYKD